MAHEEAAGKHVAGPEDMTAQDSQRFDDVDAGAGSSGGGVLKPGQSENPNPWAGLHAKGEGKVQ